MTKQKNRFNSTFKVEVGHLGHGTGGFGSPSRRSNEGWQIHQWVSQYHQE